MTRRAAALLLALFAATPAFAETNTLTLPPPKFAEGMPKDIGAFFDRQAQCDHWSGEDPVDAKRTSEINQAMDKLRCKQLDEDEDKLKKSHTGDQAVLDRLQQADDFYVSAE